MQMKLFHLTLDSAAVRPSRNCRGAIAKDLANKDGDLVDATGPNSGTGAMNRKEIPLPRPIGVRTASLPPVVSDASLFRGLRYRGDVSPRLVMPSPISALPAFQAAQPMNHAGKKPVSPSNLEEELCTCLVTTASPLPLSHLAQSGRLSSGKRPAGLRSLDVKSRDRAGRKYGICG